MNNNEIVINKLWKVGLAVGVLLSIFLLVISIKELKSINYVGKDTPIMNSITVNGKGDSVSIPDIATFSFSVTETAKVIDEAQANVTAKINNTLKALKDNGVADKDIKTLSYSINPDYEYDQTGSICAASKSSQTIPCRPGASVLTGYNVSQTIEVKIRDLKKAGALFATIGSLNVHNVNGLQFSIDDIDSVKAKARDIAIQNAKEKAKTLAQQLGVSLVRITSFYDTSDEPPFWGREGMGGDVMTMKSAVAPMAIEVPAGEQKITSIVSITYEIK